MTLNAELYVKKAEEFEAKAEEAVTASAKTSYNGLARAYLQLASHAMRSHAMPSDAEIEALARRIVAK